jgi:hypothetical protein
MVREALTVLGLQLLFPALSARLSNAIGLGYDNVQAADEPDVRAMSGCV